MKKLLHLDPVGGIAGDMFVGALLDTYPQFAADAIAAVRSCGIGTEHELAHVAHNDGILSGSRFQVTVADGNDAAEHNHVHWSSLRKRLTNSPLGESVRERAIDIFAHLAEAEARVHGKAVVDVAFHEVGAIDSIADIVAAASVLDAIGECRWSIGKIPIGSGRVNSQHGLLPVPAPATVLLLEGFDCFDDGVVGERVTPTGAAIVRHLMPSEGIGRQAQRLIRTGYGFGTKRFEGMSNVLRVLEFASNSDAQTSDQVALISFDIDDQTAEDLALALDHLRRLPGAIDILQSSAIGKNGRAFAQIQIIALIDQLETIADACFRTTTTLGLRTQIIERRILHRREVVDGEQQNVKIAERPGGASAKAEIANVAEESDHNLRQQRRRAAETAALRDHLDD